MKISRNGLAALLATLGIASAWAQAASDAHAAHGTAPTAATQVAPPRNAGAMDHGSMQGGSAPADARDPHGYSGGYPLRSGPYALDDTHALHMADEEVRASLLVNRLERVRSHGDRATVYDGRATIGTDANRLVLKAEGDVARGKLEEARTELLWQHAIDANWDTQLGVRHDSGSGAGRERSWLAFGVQGLAPYWFELDATAYVGDSGRTALRLEAEYELLLTQRLILQPRAELAAYGRNDEARHIGRGLSSGAVGVRLRYEVTPQIAPYVGVEYGAKFGRTADFARADGERTRQTRWVAGLRFWY